MPVLLPLLANARERGLSVFTPEEFWRIYNKPAYDALKRKYDPFGRFRDLYAKCVLRE